MPILVGITPLASAASAVWIRRNLFGSIIPDAMIARLERAERPRAEGRRICLELIAELAEIPGVAGVHLMSTVGDARLGEIIAAARETIHSIG